MTRTEVYEFRKGANPIPTAAYDGNGNVMALVDGAGNVSGRHEYDPFGQTIRASGTMAAANPVRFSSKTVDEETDYGYRCLNPSVGRWLSRDPIEESGGLNPYGFVGNLPIQRIDLHGLSPDDFSFTSFDLGFRLPYYTNGIDGSRAPVEGETFLKKWNVSSRVALPKKCCWVVWANGEANVEFWWSYAGVPNAWAVREHELNHVFLFEANWSAMLGEINSFTDRCMSKPKAECYRNLVGRIAERYVKQAFLEQDLFDCGAYGNIFGACDRIGDSSAELYGQLIPSIEEGKKACETIP